MTYMNTAPQDCAERLQATNPETIVLSLDVHSDEALGLHSDMATSGENAASAFHEKVNRKYRAALGYAKLGYRLIPIIQGEKKPACFTGANHKEATGDPAKLRRWFRERQFDIAVSLGFNSNAIVIDIDGPEGEESLRILEGKLGPLPKDGPRSTTPRAEGGYHLWFKPPSHAFPCKSRPIAPKIDCKADAGLCCVPPAKGRAWAVPLVSPDKLPELPQAWADYLMQKRIDDGFLHDQYRKENITTRSGRRASSALENPDGYYPEGTRNSSLASYAGWLRSKGYDYEDIYEKISDLNLERCNPPLDDDEVEAIAQSICRYPAGGDDKDEGDEVEGEAMPSSAEAVGEDTEITGNKPKQLPSINLADGSVVSLSAEAWQAFTQANDPPFMFTGPTGFTRIVKDDEGSVRLEPVNQDSFMYHLNRVASWYVKKDGGFVERNVPLSLVKDMMACAEPKLPWLVRLVTFPVVSKDGSIHLEPGYNPLSRCYYAKPAAVAIRPVADKPSPEEVKEAKWVIETLLADFPFDGPRENNPEKAHAISLMVQPFVHDLFGGKAPLSLIEAASPGTGKSLLARILLMPSVGPDLAMMPEGRDDEEWRKRMTAVISQLPVAVVIDNVKDGLTSPVLASLLTSSFWSDRILGKTETVRIPIKCSFVATGNNPTLTREISRRIVRIRLVAHSARPWLRDPNEFKVRNIEDWAASNRGLLTWACLILVRNWFSSGCPSRKALPDGKAAPTLGMYEKWSEVMGGILEAAGIGGFLGNLDELYESSDQEGNTLSGFVESWWETYDTTAVSASELYTLAYGPDVKVNLELRSATEQGRKVQLGRILQKMKDCTFGDYKVLRDSSRHGSTYYRLEPMAKGGDGVSMKGDPPETHLKNSQYNHTVSESGDSSDSLLGLANNQNDYPMIIYNTYVGAMAGDSPDSPSPPRPTSPTLPVVMYAEEPMRLEDTKW